MTKAKEVLAAAFDVSPSDIPDDAGIATFRPWDSLGHLRVVAELESRLGRPVSTEELLEIMDLASISRLMEQATLK